MRLNKYIASCGAASRRGADTLISEGRVSVNGTCVSKLGTDIDENADTVSIDGKVLCRAENKVYIMLNKPKGVLCTCSDDRGRKTVLSLLSNMEERLYPVGRLDYDTEGLLLLTNDGDFAYRCTHPKHELSKTYQAVVRGSLTAQMIEQLRKGVHIGDVITSPASVDIEKTQGDLAWVRIVIHEGRNRQVKRMFESVGCRVEMLRRTAIGGLELGDLETGKWRKLSKKDFERLDLLR